MTLIFVFSIPWENAITIPGIGTISRALGVPLAAAWVLMLTTSDSFRTPSTYIVSLFLYVFWCSLTVFWHENTDIAFRQMITFAQLYLSVLIIWTVIDTVQRTQVALQAFLLGSWVVAIIVFYNYAQGNVTRWDKRASISGVDENDIALTIAACLPIGWYLARKTAQTNLSKLIAVVNFAFIPAGLVAIIMTGSRGGVVATLPFFIYLLLSFRTMKLGRKIIVFILLVLAGLIATIFVPETPLNRIADTADQLDSRNISGRYDIWQEGISLWLSNGLHFAFGLGVGGYYWEVGRAAHSTYVSVLVETGIFGMAIFLTSVVLLFLSIRRAPSFESSFALAMLAAWIIGAAALSWEYRKPTWIIWGLLASLVHASRYQNIQEDTAARSKHSSSSPQKPL